MKGGIDTSPNYFFGKETCIGTCFPKLKRFDNLTQRGPHLVYEPKFSQIDTNVKCAKWFKPEKKERHESELVEENQKLIWEYIANPSSAYQATVKNISCCIIPKADRFGKTNVNICSEKEITQQLMDLLRLFKKFETQIQKGNQIYWMLYEKANYVTTLTQNCNSKYKESLRLLIKTFKENLDSFEKTTKHINQKQLLLKNNCKCNHTICELTNYIAHIKTHTVMFVHKKSSKRIPNHEISILHCQNLF